MKASAGIARTASPACTVDAHASTQMPVARLSAACVPNHLYGFSWLTCREPGETAALASGAWLVTTGCFTADSLRGALPVPRALLHAWHLAGFASVGGGIQRSF